MSAVRDAIRGKVRPEDRDSEAGGGETPRVNGYAFVDDEEDEEEDLGTLPAPIIDLGPGDATPNPFRIQERKGRESLHHRMVERIAKSKRESSKAGLVGKVDKTPVPKFPSSPKVSGGLTPAGERLWSKLGGSGMRTPKMAGSTPLRARGSLLKSVSRPSQGL
jgi:protein DGCR14